MDVEQHEAAVVERAIAQERLRCVWAGFGAARLCALAGLAAARPRGAARDAAAVPLSVAHFPARILTPDPDCACGRTLSEHETMSEREA